MYFPLFYIRADRAAYCFYPARIQTVAAAPDIRPSRPASVRLRYRHMLPQVWPIDRRARFCKQFPGSDAKPERPAGFLSASTENTHLLPPRVTALRYPPHEPVAEVRAKKITAQRTGCVIVPVPSGFRNSYKSTNHTDRYL